MKTIRELRHELGLTQTELAERLGVTLNATWRWEQRQNEPPARHLRALAQMCNVSMDEIDFETTKRAGREPPSPETEDGGLNPHSLRSGARRSA